MNKSLMKLMAWLVILLGIIGSTPILASVHVVMDGADLECRNISIASGRGLKVYKDPNLWDWKDLEENPLLTVLTGRVNLKTGTPAPFKAFRKVTQLYEQELFESFRFDPNMKPRSGGNFLTHVPVNIVPIQICSGAYQNTLGFVLEHELKNVDVEIPNPGKMPPSTPGHPIPKLVE